MCVSPSSAHTHPKLDSYQESYQAWRHAPGQPALKGFSYSHALPPLCSSGMQSVVYATWQRPLGLSHRTNC